MIRDRLHGKDMATMPAHELACAIIDGLEDRARLGSAARDGGPRLELAQVLKRWLSEHLEARRGKLQTRWNELLPLADSLPGGQRQPIVEEMLALTKAMGLLGGEDV